MERNRPKSSKNSPFPVGGKYWYCFSATGSGEEIEAESCRPEEPEAMPVSDPDALNSAYPDDGGAKAVSAATPPDTYTYGGQAAETLIDMPIPVPSPCECESMSDFLKTKLGRPVRAVLSDGETVQEREGTLAKAGGNFIVLKINDSASLVCALDSVKFINILE